MPTVVGSFLMRTGVGGCSGASLPGDFVDHVVTEEDEEDAGGFEVLFFEWNTFSFS